MEEIKDCETFVIGQKVMVRDEDGFFVKGKIVDLYPMHGSALVTYETDDGYVHSAVFTLDQLHEWLEDWRDISLETRSWY